MPGHLPTCQVLPLPDQQVSFRIRGREQLRWHFGDRYPRPFFYPVMAPGTQTSLTRMGHPGAPNHDHHRSVWFAHHKVLGIDFWSENTEATIRQQQWLAYEDGDDECRMAVRLGWYDGHDPQPLLQQDLVVFVRPHTDEGGAGSEDDYTLEVQSTFKPHAQQLELQQTNFGVFAVRVAKSLSAYFGGGQLTGSDGKTGEPALFGQPNRWMDYSGPVDAAEGPASSADSGGDGRARTAGITYFDHPENVSYPSKWHVREDGWMGASICRDHAVLITADQPLRLRYLLHLHDGDYNAAAAERLATRFADSPAAEVVKSNTKHTHYEIRRPTS